MHKRWGGKLANELVSVSGPPSSSARHPLRPAILSGPPDPLQLRASAARVHTQLVTLAFTFSRLSWRVYPVVPGSLPLSTCQLICCHHQYILWTGGRNWRRVGGAGTTAGD